MNAREVCTLDTQAHFQSIQWNSLAPGAREKRVSRSDVTLRLLEFSPPFFEHEWCTKSHVGYVIDGGFTVQYRDRAVSLVAGDGLCIVGGESHAHKAVVDRTVLLFLIEPNLDGNHIIQ